MCLVANEVDVIQVHFQIIVWAHLDSMQLVHDFHKHNHGRSTTPLFIGTPVTLMPLLGHPLALSCHFVTTVPAPHVRPSSMPCPYISNPPACHICMSIVLACHTPLCILPSCTCFQRISNVSTLCSSDYWSDKNSFPSSL